MNILYSLISGYYRSCITLQGLLRTLLDHILFFESFTLQEALPFLRAHRLSLTADYIRDYIISPPTCPLIPSSL